MLRELLAIWRSRDPLDDLYKTLAFMIDKGERMFEAAWQEVLAGRLRPEVREDILRTDIEVNKAERLIRKRLLEHLVAQSGAHAPTCLALMSVVKDAERVGDYCKDILDAMALQTQPLSQCSCAAEFESLYEEIHTLFERTRRALTEADKPLAQDVMLSERQIAARCDALLERLASEDIPARVGVPWALVTRYLRRTAAHLSNLASSLVMPLHKLDYHDEKWLSGGKGKEIE